MDLGNDLNDTNFNNNNNNIKVSKERWNLLKNAIMNNKKPASEKTSTSQSNSSSSSTNGQSTMKKMHSFGLIKYIKHAYKNDARHDDESDENDENLNENFNRVNLNKHEAKSSSHGNWYNVHIPKLKLDNDLFVRFYQHNPSLEDLAGFNNTGNVGLWPSEEVMAYFCIKNSSIFENKSVCELGGGMTCLAGLMLCTYSNPSEVFLTDGNEACFKNLETICSKNEFGCVVECCLLRWNKETFYEDLEKRFDYIICADCLFFDETREHLCATIYKLLKKDGVCFVFAPNRKNTFHKFVDYAKGYFECVIVNNYDDDVWSRHLKEKETNDNYDQDVDYPLLLQLKKSNKNKVDYCKMLF